MKVSVVGHIIETKHIYAIKKAIHENGNSKFLILLHGRRCIEIELSVFTLFEQDNIVYHKATREQREFYYKKVSDSITALRNNLIDLWNQEKSEIIQLEF